VNARRPQRGQTLVEFALVFPIFLVVLLATFDIGRGVFAYNSVTNAAREGARLAIVNQDKTLVLARIRSQSSVAESNNGDGTDITIEYRRANTDGTPSNTNCVAAGENIPIGCLAVVTYQTKFQLITPLVRQIVFPSGVTLTSTSILPVEFTCPNPDITIGTNCPKQP
jgi:Flp pilus assembly protein TadG